MLGVLRTIIRVAGFVITLGEMILSALGTRRQDTGPLGGNPPQ